MKNFVLEKENHEKVYWKVCEIIKDIYRETLKTAIKYKNHLVIDFLNKRKFTPKITETYQIGFAPLTSHFLTNELQKKINNKEEYENFIQRAKELGYLNDKNNDFFRNRIILPIFDANNQIIGFGGRSLNSNEKIKYLNSKESIIFKKSNFLFNLNNYHDENTIPKQINIAEGYIDAITFSSKYSQTENIVATIGTSFSDEQLNLLLNKNITHFHIFPDHDDSGINHAIRTAHKILAAKQKVFINEYDTSCKDIDELVNKNKANTIKAYDYFEWYYSKLKQQKNEIDSVKLLINEIIEYAPNSFEDVFEKCLQQENFDKNETKKYFEQQLIKKTNDLNNYKFASKTTNNNEQKINKDSKINSVQASIEKELRIT